jgi:hypothetical protein
VSALQQCRTPRDRRGRRSVILPASFQSSRTARARRSPADRHALVKVVPSIRGCTATHERNAVAGSQRIEHALVVPGPRRVHGRDGPLSCVPLRCLRRRLRAPAVQAEQPGRGGSPLRAHVHGAVRVHRPSIPRWLIPVPAGVQRGRPAGGRSRRAGRVRVRNRGIRRGLRLALDSN